MLLQTWVFAVIKWELISTGSKTIQGIVRNNGLAPVPRILAERGKTKRRAWIIYMLFLKQMEESRPFSIRSIFQRYKMHLPALFVHGSVRPPSP